MQKLRTWTKIAAVGLLFAAYAGSALADYQALLKQATAGDQKAQLGLGHALMYGYEGAPKNTREAVRWLTAAQKGGGAYGRSASVNLGIIYGNRSYGQPNGPKAVKLLEDMARYPDMPGKMARVNLGAMYLKEPDQATVPMNYDKALFWYFAAQASAAPSPPGSGVEHQIDTTIRTLMTRSSESAVEIRGRAVEWVRRVEIGR